MIAWRQSRHFLKTSIWRQHPPRHSVFRLQDLLMLSCPYFIKSVACRRFSIYRTNHAWIIRTFIHAMYRINHINGFPAEFYKRCWHIIKGDLLPMFQDLFAGNLQLFHLNFGTITLLPKKTEPVRIEQFRPICLLNVSFKIFTKVGTNRPAQIAHSVVQPSI